MLDVMDWVADSCVLGDDISIINLPFSVSNDIFEASPFFIASNISVSFSRDKSITLITAPSKLKAAFVWRPSMFIITNQSSFGVCRQGCLAVPDSPKNKADVPSLALAEQCIGNTSSSEAM